MLLHQVEFLHTYFFWVSVAFFFACSFTLVYVFRTFKRLGLYAQHLPLLDLVAEDDPELAAKSFGKIDATRSAIEFVAFRKRFIKQVQDNDPAMPEGFRFHEYLQERAADHLRELVNINPMGCALFFWLPTVMLGMLVEEKRHGFRGGSHLCSHWFFVPMVIFNCGLAIWSLWNFWRMLQIRRKLTPTGSDLVAEYDADVHCKSSLGGILARWWGKPARNTHEQLFGFSGARGPNFFMDSMRLLLFSSISNMGYCLHIMMKAQSEHAMSRWHLAHQEAMVFGLLAAKNVVFLCFLPVTFMLYNWVTSIEELKDKRRLTEVLIRQNIRRLSSTLATLTIFRNRLEGISNGSVLEKPSEEKVDLQWRSLLKVSSPIRPNTVLDMYTLFKLADDDGRGTIDLKEMLDWIQGFNWRVSRESLEKLHACMDVDGNGDVSFKEFATAIFCSADASLVNVSDHVKEDIFNLFDADGGGTIDWSEFSGKLAELGFDINGAEHVFGQFVSGPQGVISRTSFLKYLDKSCKEFSDTVT
jgi:Ca2+-binding EF-hand superfamily protein